MRLSAVPAVLLLTTATLTGLVTGSHRLESCGDSGSSFIDHVLCDPDHLVSSPYDHVIVQILTKCGHESGHKVVVFLAANSTQYDKVKPKIPTATTITTTDTNQHSGNDRGGDGAGSTEINRLKKLVVAANNLTTTTSSVILLIGIRDKFQMATWWSDSLSDVLTSATVKEAQQNVSTPLDQEHFTSAVVHVACYLCQSTRGSSSRTPLDIFLTVVWIVFTIAFVCLLVTIAVVLLTGRHKAVVKARAEGSQQRSKQSSSLPYPVTRASDLHDFSVVSFTSTGHVLLGTTDIEAIAAQECSSMDNLLQD